MVKLCSVLEEISSSSDCQLRNRSVCCRYVSRRIKLFIFDRVFRESVCVYCLCLLNCTAVSQSKRFSVINLIRQFHCYIVHRLTLHTVMDRCQHAHVTVRIYSDLQMRIVVF